MSKKGTIIDKLGFGSFRLRGNPQQTYGEDLDLKTGGGNGQTSVNTITGGELDLPMEIVSRYSSENLEALVSKPHKKTLREKIWGSRHEESPVNSSKSVFYVDEAPVMVTTATEEDNNETTAGQEKKKKHQPEGTVEYTVQDRDTLEKIAAHFDTTPSELKKLNKLISAMIFAGQVLYIPDKEYVPRKSTSSVSSEDSSSQHQGDSVFGSPQDKPKMDVPLVRSGNNSPSKVPGHVERQPASPTAFDFEVVAPHKLSEDEVQQLDQDCMERFIKLKVKHITDGQGVVKGTLLVTPNAVMFDPDVSDPLVLEHGAEKYGMIAPMDMIISAAMYHDIAAMKLRGKKQEDGTNYPRPEVYHDKACPMAKEKLLSSQKTDQSKHSSTSLSENLKNILRNPLNKSESVCSCGKGVNSDKLDSVSGDETDGLNLHEELNKGRPDEAHSNGESGDKSMNDNVFSDGNNGDTDTIDNSVEEVDSSGNGTRVKSSPRLDSRGQKKLSVSFSLPETDTVSPGKEKISPGLETLLDLEDTGVTNTDKDKELVDIGNEQESAKSQPSDKTQSDDEYSSNGDKETRIGNIVYLPVEEDANGEVTVQSVEKTANTLSKLSVDEFSQISKSDTDLVDSGLSIENKEVEKTRSSSTSSLGPFSPTPHLSAFVNYATGFFQRHASDSSIKDIKDVIIDSLPDLKMPESIIDSKDSKDETKFDVPTVSAAPTPAGRRGKMSRHGNLAQPAGNVAVENAVTMDEKPDLMTMDYDKFAPRKSQAYPDPPLYLCLRLGTPQNKNVFHNYSIESYGRRRKKSEYWFSIPREKVDHLYAFFVQWTPEIYGDEEEITPEKRGFVVIEDDESEDLEMLDEHFGPNSTFAKDWEMINKRQRIISQSEAIKRRSIVYEEPIPLPELIGESTILKEFHISELCQVMPGRTVGYPWTLIYSTDKHGFSLKTLYRDMVGLESPILIAVKDTNDNIFGALTSCQLKYSDSFYGTGETFLFTFYPEFKVFNWTGENNFFIKGNQESLSIGAGQGVFGLWFDEDLYHGRTNKCETFDNDLLTSSEDFVVKGVEAWAFIWD
ncbi:nuclear receptor coactivator 7-like isoform X4 [Ruditapes philippinarum]|uniref:nuclear receptor coactivator 7-like isoform X4 n=1 Tax=Ruditapes philippinarum TaxID=129788 RepID=UPI00295A8132|nr:nuclear receptor coactivator 7-like isoform X4 [Ruditapes philippinarum]